MSIGRSAVTDRRHRSKLIAALSIAALAAMLLLGYLIWSGHQEAIHAAETTTRNYAAIIEARLDATLRRADADLQRLAHTIPVAALSRRAARRYARDLNAELDSFLINFPELSGVRIVDANGDWIYSSASETTPRTNISDRGYFRQLRDDPLSNLVFSEVVIARATGRPSLVLAKSLRDERGAFRGAAVVLIEIGYFHKLFQSLDLGAHGTISWRRTDDHKLVLRWPHLDDAVNKPLNPQSPTVRRLAAGDKITTQHISAQTDGVARIISTDKLGHYPFYVNVAFGRDDVLAAWRTRALVVGLCGLSLLALLTGLLYRLLRAEDSLIANEELMRSTFEQAAVGIAHIAPDTYRILMANDKFCNLLGYTPDELIGKDSRILKPPDDIPGPEAEWAQVAAGTIKASSSERPLARKDGVPLWVNRSLSLVRDPAGRPKYFISVIEDISARRQAEEARAQLAAIAESLGDAIYIRDLDGMITFWNGGAVGVYGYTSEEMVGTLGDVTVPPDLLQEARQNRQEALRGRTIANFETVRTRKDGRRIDLSISLAPVKDGGGKIIGVAAISRDITERKQADARQRLAASVFESAAEGIIIADKDFRIVAVNGAFNKITGYSATEVIGRNLRVLRSYRHDAAFYIGMRRAVIETGIWRGEIWNKRKDGTRYCQLLAITTVNDEQGKVTNYCTIFADITERKVAEAELVRLNAELEERVASRTAELEAANRQLGTFGYAVAHDLRAPLRAINGFSAMVLEANEGKLDPTSVSHLRRVTAGSKRMGELIDDLLKLTKLSRQEMRWREIKLSELAVGVVAALTEAHPERNVLVTIQPGMKTGGDQGLMRIVLENLIGNAWKFTEKTGAARIEIGTEQRDGKTVYYVRDNGAGFDMEYAHKLFAPFQRLHRSQQFEGTGIGLATVKSVVERHGGKIWIESAVDLGTTVFFTIGKSA